jgi:hypothetical protein
MLIWWRLSPWLPQNYNGIYIQSMLMAFLNVYVQYSPINLASVIKGEMEICVKHLPRCGEVHTIAENLIAPCVENMVSCVLNNYLVIKKVPPADCTVSRWIEDMSCNMDCLLIKGIKSSQDFSMHVHEFTSPALLFGCISETHDKLKNACLNKRLAIHSTGSFTSNWPAHGWERP